MNKFSYLLAGIIFLLLSCSPKSGNKASDTTFKPDLSAPARSTAPVIPLPTGDVRKKAPVPGSAPKVQIGKAETFKLDNGLTVILVENHKLPKVSYRVFVDYDPVLQKEAAGYLDMAGELLTKGTKSYSKSQIDAQVDFIGANLASDANGLSGGSLKKHSEKLLTLMSDVLLNPTFPLEELEKAKKKAASGLASQKNDANAIAGNVAAILRYGKNHPYGEVMTESTLANITLDQIKNHYKTYFKPNISYLVITGDITRAEAEKQARQYFGKWEKGVVPTHQHSVPRAPEKTTVDFVHRAGAVQSVINITYPVELKPGAPDVIRSRVANSLLGGYFNSRLNYNLRETHGWTYGAGSSLNQDILVGMFNASASVRNAVTDSSIIEFLKEMRRLGEERVPEEELQVVKNVMAGNFSRSLEEPGTVASFALNTARYQLPADYYEKYLEVLQQVTPDDILEMSKKYIRPDKAHILVVGNKDEVAERLKQFSADGKINFYDAFGNPVKVANTTLPQGLTAEQVIDDYLNAIGGKAKISGIKDMQSNAVMEMRGQSLYLTTYQKGGTKISIEMSMNGMVMNRQVYDGQQGIQSSMGQVENLDEATMADMKEQAKICKEADYKSGGYQLTLKGMEEINGTMTFVVEVMRPYGRKITEYYDTKTSLKLREVSTELGMDGNPVTQTVDMSDYKEINGVKMPHALTISGLFPVPVKVTIGEIKVNTGINDEVFKI